jgi:Trk-type K+ transport system membrane component
LSAAQDGTPWEITFDGVSAAAGVGWTSGLASHLTIPARGLMIAVMLTGRLLPMLWWCWMTRGLSRDEQSEARA